MTAPGRPRAVVPVLGYHSISDEPRDGTLRWSVSPGDFDEQMALLAQRGRTPLTVTAYAAMLRGEAPPPPRPVLVTFDDGFADLAETALPVLRRYGLTATAYVITSRIGSPRTRRSDPFLDWDAVAELRAGGVEIGSHSHTHRALDCLARGELPQEITLSRLALEDALGERVSSFAYPYGYSSAAVRRAVRAAGYTSACAVKNALSHGADDPFAIARVLVERDAGTATIEALLDGRGWPLAWRGEQLRTRGWRAYRRARRYVGLARAGAGRAAG
ncbi:Polysaccharide deacetylase [Micromonospora pattaloongensis]|uniref:Polysaccharide deacetylase n=1 Tax=Micromonospora pattaloongensis TaxID=405436 RepID=A0A1H3NUU1_9ACTN|nr:polysaccharide deacetylase family protein [Micromonospora pattaloongensis]SDY92677.1 Polysaccharide deacetylase [Micromonospora pattaloongensis]